MIPRAKPMVVATAFILDAGRGAIGGGESMVPDATSADAVNEIIA
jgi:hypothetical protein